MTLKKRTKERGIGFDAFTREKSERDDHPVDDQSFRKHHSFAKDAFVFLSSNANQALNENENETRSTNDDQDERQNAHLNGSCSVGVMTKPFVASFEDDMVG